MLTKKDKIFITNIKNEIIESKKIQDYDRVISILNALYGFLKCDATFYTTTEEKEQIKLKLSSELHIPIDLDSNEVKINEKVKQLLLSDFINAKDIAKLQKLIKKVKKGEILNYEK